MYFGDKDDTGSNPKEDSDDDDDPVPTLTNRRMLDNDGNAQDEQGNDDEEDVHDEESDDDNDEDDEVSLNHEDDALVITTRSGRQVNPRIRLIEEISAATVDEIMAVGSGIGGGFIHTSELAPMKYNEAMAKDPKGWEEAVQKEHEQMVKHEVWKPVPVDQVPRGAKILTSTWAMKLKVDGTKRARINARGYEQRPGEHYNETNISSPVVNEASIFIILILMIMGDMWGELNDVRGAFLNGVFSGGEQLYMRVPQGFEKYYAANILLLLMKTIYGLKQASFEYWRALLKALKTVGLERSKADPCIYFKWTANGLMLWSSWVDDLLSCGDKKEVTKGREALKQHFDLDEIGELKEYVGCKILHNREKRYMVLTQLVLIQSFSDEFELPKEKFNTPAAPGSVLMGDDSELLDKKMHHMYRKGVGKLIHLGKYSKSECLNRIRELSRFGSKPNYAHYKSMLRTSKYCIDTKSKGLMLKPNRKWDPKDRSFQFEITGKSDSDFAKDPETRKSVSGWATFINGAPFVRKSKMQRFVMLSVTEAESVAATSCAQDMLYGKRFLEALGLKVKLPMVLYMDNKGGVDIFNNWSVGGNTRAISVRLAFLRELKEQNILVVEWTKGETNCADLFTKNLDGATMKKHSEVFSGSQNDDTEEEE